MIFVLLLTIASRKRVHSWGRPPKCRIPKKTHTFWLFSTSKQSHMKVGSTNWRLGAGLIKTLINPPSFDLGLMVRRKTHFSVWHVQTIVTLISLTNLLNMSSLICQDFFVRQRTVFDNVKVTCRNYHLWPDQSVKVCVLRYFCDDWDITYSIKRTSKTDVSLASRDFFLTTIAQNNIPEILYECTV